MTKKSSRRLSRATFLDGAQYAEALRGAGGPGIDEMDDLTTLPGEAGEILRATFGVNQAAFDAAVEAEQRAAQWARPHVFVIKRTGRRTRKKPS